LSERPLVSIGFPVYNGEQRPWMREALDSLLAQTYDNLEIVICDNASTDGTAAVCAEYVVRDKRVRYHRNATNIGMIPNFNRVFELSTGEYFMWAASDDARPPDVVEASLAAFAEHPDAVMVHGPLLLDQRKSGQLILQKNEMDLSHPDPVTRIRIFTEQIGHNSMFYGLCKREPLTRTSLGRHWGPDYFVCMNMSLFGPVAYMPTVMMTYRQRNGPVHTAMYPLVPITLFDLFVYRGVRRAKCWVVLFLGCYYMLTARGVELSVRIRAAFAHARAFLWRYPKWLASELVFILFTPFAWVTRLLLPIGLKFRDALRRRGLVG
jgi:hypothetical protein